jgi:hypothetical protein
VLRIKITDNASSIQNFILSRNSTRFGHLLFPSSGVISCTRGNWYVSCRLCGRCLGESGCSILLIIYTKIITMHGHLNINYFVRFRVLCHFFLVPSPLATWGWKNSVTILTRLCARRLVKYVGTLAEAEIYLQTGNGAYLTS